MATPWRAAATNALAVVAGRDSALGPSADATPASPRAHARVHIGLGPPAPVRPPHPLTRYQVANCYMGRAGLINSGGASSGDVSSPAATLAASTLTTPPT
jgi:DhnA family fructose-bisphosphate aldolase class Ia